MISALALGPHALLFLIASRLNESVDGNKKMSAEGENGSVKIENPLFFTSVNINVTAFYFCMPFKKSCVLERIGITHDFNMY